MLDLAAPGLAVPQTPLHADTSTARPPALPQHYQLKQSLGQGGFGEVFEAWDDKLRRSVAIKRLRQAGDATQSVRLIAEARLAASLQHAAFVKIYALEEYLESQSIVMELVRGQTLKQVLAQAPLGATQALAIIGQIAEAMREAHDSGLVHGDLKPSNVMVEPSGTVRILDFGLASQTDAEITSSLPQGDPQGTIAYMAPERLLGQPLRPASDIYALGVMLYEMLTGARPFAELSGLALAAAHMQSSAELWPYPRGMRPALVQLVRDMAARLPQHRLASMDEVGARLQRLNQDAAGPAHGATTPRATDGPPRHPPDTAAGTPDATPGAPAPRLAAWWRQAARRRQAALAGALLLALGGAWLALPYAPSLAAMKTALQPYSETVEMRDGLRALATWDRPGELEEAERHFATVLDHNPNNAAAVAGLSATYSRRYTTDHQDEVWLRKARAAAQQALKLNPQLAFSHAAMANVLTLEGKQELALQAFEQAIKLDPENIFALNGQINPLLKSRRYDAALQVAQDYARRYPKEQVFADQIGSIHFAQGHYADAEQAFRRSIQIQPDTVVGYANLSAALASQGKIAEALHVLQQGLQVRPSAWLYTNLGNVLFMQGDYPGAAAAFEAAVAPSKGNPADYLGWANLADTLLWIPGREAEARRAYAHASELLAPRLEQAPDDVTLVSRMSLYFARSGDKQKCQDLLLRALALAPNSAAVQFRAGLAYELIGERQRALQAIANAARLGYPNKFIEAAPELVALRRDAEYAQRP